MNRILSLAALSLALAAGLLGSAAAQERVVNVYNWSDYIDEAVLAQFTEETGIKVVYDVYDNNEIILTKLLAGGSGYDIVVPTDSTMTRLIRADALQPLDKSLLPNLSHMWPLINERLQVYDPGNEYAVNYMWGTTAFAYNKASIEARMPDAPVDSWDMLFKPEVLAKFADCGVQVIDTPEDVFQSALNYLGLDPQSKDPDELARANDLLKSIRPYIQKFNSSEYINALANGDICLALGYSGDLLQARDRAAEANNGVEVVYVIPKEGALMWFDSMVIPADAPHVKEAHEFINFMMRPDIAAKNSNYVFYANGNIDSQPLLSDDVKSDPAIYPPEATLQRLFTSVTYEPAVQRTLTRMWTELKAGR